MTNANSYTPKFLAEMVCNTFEAIMPGRAASSLGSNFAWHKVDLIVQDNNFLRRDFVKSGNRSD